MMSMKIGPALAAGNCLIMKSSEKAPLTSLLLARLSKEAGIPDGVLNILSGFGRPCGDALARHPEIRKIAFTGSVATGKLVQKAAAESNLKSCTLELGGKSPLIVFEDADLVKAAKAAAHSITINSGQVCMASSRVYVQKSVAEAFTTLYKKALEDISGSMGDPLDLKTMYGPVADRAQAKGILSHLQRAKEQNSTSFSALHRPTQLRVASSDLWFSTECQNPPQSYDKKSSGTSPLPPFMSSHLLSYPIAAQSPASTLSPVKNLSSTAPTMLNMACTQASLHAT